jgi:hypothetical protein
MSFLLGMGVGCSRIDGGPNWRSGRVKEVMAGNFDLLGIVADGKVQP